MNLVDSHQHFWSRERGDYFWLSPHLGVLYADYLPADIHSELTACGIDRTILVQAAPTVEETNFMLGLAETIDFIAGVVGWVDLELPDTPDIIASLATHPKLKGIRPMIQDIDDLNWIAKPELAPAINALIEHGLCFDALVQTKHIDSLLEMMTRHAALPVVIDHGAKPPISSGDISEWKKKIAKVAESTNAHCKVSGLVTEVCGPIELADIEPIFEHLYCCFGADRLMWGSDWPVVKMRMEYDSWYAMTRELLTPLPAGEQKKILSTNAEEFYGI